MKPLTIEETASKLVLCGGDMRDILFRAKAINRDEYPLERRTDYKNGDWVYGLISKFNDYREYGYPVTCEFTNEDGVTGIEVDHNTIGQYIGTTDINKRNIFEGDIVTMKYGGYAVCLFDEETKAFKIINHYSTSISLNQEYLTRLEVKIVGNIYDNPELLEEMNK